MMIPSRRKLGAAALIIAGIGAFMVPFLLHSPSTQGTSSNNGGTNPNNGSHTTTPAPTTRTPTTPTGRCSADKAKDPSPADNGEGKHNGNAWGVLKNQMDTTVAAVKAMGTHNAAFQLHHDTKTDNDTVKAHNTSSGDSNENHSSCSEKDETNDN
ncbi:MAG TPA: hypothetical protein VNA15_08095 [Candidatus Angelobacter sp.]|nr:hypothetical protein [Candidatus Angelobacter sp.]